MSLVPPGSGRPGRSTCSLLFQGVTYCSSLPMTSRDLLPFHSLLVDSVLACPGRSIAETQPFVKGSQGWKTSSAHSAVCLHTRDGRDLLVFPAYWGHTEKLPRWVWDAGGVSRTKTDAGGSTIGCIVMLLAKRRPYELTRTAIAASKVSGLVLLCTWVHPQPG